MRLAGIILSALLGAAFAGAPFAAHAAIPDSVRSAGVTQQEWDQIIAQARAAAIRAGASEQSLISVAERLGVSLAQDGQTSAAEILAQIDELAARVSGLEIQVAALSSAGNEQVEALLAQVRLAVDAGDLDQADALLEQAQVVQSESLNRAEAQLHAERLSAAQVSAARANLSSLRFDNLGAAALYAQAAERTPEDAVQERWNYRIEQGLALQRHGVRVQDPAFGRQALQILETLALTLAPRNTSPDNWASTQNAIGNIHMSFAQDGDERARESARESAARAYRNALTVWTREHNAQNWAMAQMHLANVLAVRHDETSIRQGIAAYEYALTAIPPREGVWAAIHKNISTANVRLARLNGDRSLYERAWQAAQEAIEATPREQYPDEWADTQEMLGTIFQETGATHYPAAIQAYEQAVSVRPRTDRRERWAATQVRLGNLLAFRTMQAPMPGSTPQYDTDPDNVDRRLRSIAAFEAALTIYTRENNTGEWINAKMSLASLYEAQQRRNDARAAAEAALEAATQANDAVAAGRARMFLANHPPIQ